MMKLNDSNLPTQEFIFKPATFDKLHQTKVTIALKKEKRV